MEKIEAPQRALDSITDLSSLFSGFFSGLGSLKNPTSSFNVTVSSSGAIEMIFKPTQRHAVSTATSSSSGAQDYWQDSLRLQQSSASLFQPNKTQLEQDLAELALEDAKTESIVATPGVAQATTSADNAPELVRQPLLPSAEEESPGSKGYSAR